MNSTLLKFGYPENTIYEYENWVLLLRPVQVTFGSLVLLTKSLSRTIADLDASSLGELSIIVGDLENILRDHYNAEKFNYLALMMIDPEVHFHIIPRYSSAVIYHGEAYEDKNWPGAPVLSETLHIDQETFNYLLLDLKDEWKGIKS